MSLQPHILTETHLHTLQSSLCAHFSAEKIPALYKKHGYGNIIITDHWNENTLDQFAGDCHQKNRAWFQSFEILSEAAEKENINVFLGMEIRLNDCPEDYLIYGITFDFIKEYPDLYRCDVKKLFSVIDSAGFLLYQAHPFRGYLDVQPPEFLHGIEVYNANTSHINENKKAKQYAKKHKLLQIAGSDFHHYDMVAKAGIYLPSDIKTNKQLVDYLKNGEVQLYIK